MITRMKLLRLAILFLIINTLTYSSYSQAHYRITVKLQGMTDSLLLMASYRGDKQFVVDTAYADKQFNYRFIGDSLLPDGMYIIAGSNKTKLFDFIISGKQKITITGDRTKLPGSLKSKKKSENSILFSYINFLSSRQKKMSQLQSQARQYNEGSDSLKLVMNQIDLLNDEVERYIQGLINSHRGKFISVFLNSLQDPIVPETPVLPNGRPDSVFAFHQFKQHFWDNIDLSDDRVIRTPIIHSKVEQYLTKLTPPVPDSIIVAIDRIIRLTGNNYETFKYLIWYLTVKYETSEIMGHDAIFVHIADTYYGDRRISWMNATVKQNLIKRANALRPILIGKTAPEMILLDTLQRPVSLHTVNNKYTIIYFWDPECSHCKKETPLLKSFYDEFKNKYDLAVYAVCMDTSWKAMKSYILKNKMNWINVNGYYSMTPDFRELYDVHSSPVMFMIDEHKKIIAKRIMTDQMKGILERLYLEDPFKF